MTRKDYVNISDALRDLAMYCDEGVKTWSRIAVWDSIANVLQGDNPRFDRDRFIEACRPKS